VVFGGLAAISPLNLELIKEARGYGLTSLAGALMLVAADRATSARPRYGLGGFAVAGWVGMTTHLGFVFGFLGQALGLVLRGVSRRATVIAVALAGLSSIVFYGPLLGQMVGDMLKYYASSGSGAGALPFAVFAAAGLSRPPQPWHAPLSGPISLAAPTVELLFTGDARPQCEAACFTGVELLIYGAPVAILVAIGVAGLWRRGERGLLLTLGIPPLFTFAVLTAARFFVADRFVSYLLFYVLVLAAVGLVTIASALPRVRVVRGAAGALGVVVALIAAQRLLDLNSQWVATPFENPKLVASVIEATDTDRVLTNSTRTPIFDFYLGPQRVEDRSTAELQQLFCSLTSSFVYIDHPLRSEPADTSCLQRRGASRVRVTQRGRGGRIDVWVVPAGATLTTSSDNGSVVVWPGPPPRRRADATRTG
jgi:hypothetical protein